MTGQSVLLLLLECFVGFILLPSLLGEFVRDPLVLIDDHLFLPVSLLACLCVVFVQMESEVLLSGELFQEGPLSLLVLQLLDELLFLLLLPLFLLHLSAESVLHVLHVLSEPAVFVFCRL